MRVKPIPSRWLSRDARRLDCGPYLSGAIDARIILERLPGGTVPLQKLTTGPHKGIYRPPIFGMQFARHEVNDDKHGVPFLTGTSMLMADLSYLPRISTAVATSKKFAILRLEEGMTLVSCSGTVGRVVYARPDMHGMWSSQAVMKIRPDPSLIAPGYLFAFLSSRYGVPLIAGGTYGAMVPQIEQEHLLDLPVPRLGKTIEARAHALICEAASARAEKASLLRQAHRELGLHEDHTEGERSLWGTIESSYLQDRLDAYYFSSVCKRARAKLDNVAVSSLRLGELAEVFIPGIFKRKYVGDPSLGVPYITGADVFQIYPESSRYLKPDVVDRYNLGVRHGEILVQEAGQLGGLIGRSVFVGRHLDGFAVSNNMVRVRSHNAADAGFIFAVLSSRVGQALLSREAAGSSIPHLDANRVRRMRVPWPTSEIRARISRLVEDAVERGDRAAQVETEARCLVENAIEEAA